MDRIERTKRINKFQSRDLWVYYTIGEFRKLWYYLDKNFHELHDKYDLDYELIMEALDHDRLVEFIEILAYEKARRDGAVDISRYRSPINSYRAKINLKEVEYKKGKENKTETTDVTKEGSDE
jgi:hypothetical protein